MSPSQKCITIPLRASAAAAFSLALLALVNVARASAAPQATFYVVDIGHGNVAFVVAPSGETMLLDCGPPQMADRIYDFMRQTGIEKIDYLVVSHFEADHMGAVAALAKKVRIVNYVDHGESVTYNKSDEWWKGRRSPWWREGIGAEDNRRMDAYKAARATGRHIPVKPGDKVPIQGLDVVVVAAAGKNITKPLAGNRPSNCSRAPYARRISRSIPSSSTLIAAAAFRAALTSSSLTTRPGMGRAS